MSVRARSIKTKQECRTGKYNVGALSEAFFFDEEEQWTDYPSDYEYFIPILGEWMSWKDAWEGDHLIHDNYITWFKYSEQATPEQRKRGYV